MALVNSPVLAAAAVKSTPALLILAAFSRHLEALAWARETASAHWGAVALESPVFDFGETDYYAATMGSGLKKVFWGFEPLRDQGELAGLKLESARWESEYAAFAGRLEPRPLNLDPGFVTAAKLVLASTKDHAHRIYLSQGIFAEVTLYYKHNCWQPREWTFPDYRRPDYHQFFQDCRRYFRAAAGARTLPEREA